MAPRNSAMLGLPRPFSTLQTDRLRGTAQRKARPLFTDDLEPFDSTALRTHAIFLAETGTGRGYAAFGVSLTPPPLPCGFGSAVASQALPLTRFLT